jgi:hypothetical protein
MPWGADGSNIGSTAVIPGQLMERLSKEVDVWVCHTEDFNIDDAEYFRQKGLQTRFYGPMIYEQKKNGGCGSNTFVDLDLLVNRRIGWVGWKYRSGWVEACDSFC